MKPRPHEKLIAWREAYKLCLETYRLTQTFPYNERFGLTSQIRRSAYIVPMCLSELSVIRETKRKSELLDRALTSLEELHCQFCLCRDLTYLTGDELQELDGHIRRTSYLMRKLKKSLRQPVAT